MPSFASMAMPSPRFSSTRRSLSSAAGELARLDLEGRLLERDAVALRLHVLEGEAAGAVGRGHAGEAHAARRPPRCARRRRRSGGPTRPRPPCRRGARAAPRGPRVVSPLSSTVLRIGAPASLFAREGVAALVEALDHVAAGLVGAAAGAAAVAAVGERHHHRVRHRPAAARDVPVHAEALLEADLGRGLGLAGPDRDRGRGRARAGRGSRPRSRAARASPRARR